MNLQTSKRELDWLLRRTFLCPSCSTLRLSDPRSTPRKRVRTDRYVSTSSSTAINATRPVPERNRPLHQALAEVKSKASAHVNLSRLQLALQGLETERPVTRVAIIGLNVQDTSRRIVRLLLADALEDEQTWEKQTIQHQGSHGILLRYGQPHNTNIPQRTTLPILHIPSPLLERLNVELLITSINSEHTNGSGVPAEAFLAPAVGVPTAFDGRQVTVNQPVHRSLLVANDFEELVSAIELLSATRFQSQADREAVTLVADLPNNNTQSRTRVLLSDVARAERGLKAIRTSTSQATIYEHEWIDSGMPILTKWLENDIAELDRVPPLVVTKLIGSLMTAATVSLEQRSLTAQQKSFGSALDSAARSRIENAINDFSRAAHQELQSGLASAWSSRNWRKLSWYKLFWRVDDVGLIVSDLVTNSWLPKTERATYEISGRLTQMGINPTMAQVEVPQTEHKTAFEAETARATIIDPAPSLLTVATTGPANEIVFPETRPTLKSDPMDDTTTIEMRPTPISIPITSTISLSRTGYMREQITSLTSTAQQLVLRTFSISGFSAGLSALTYVSQIAPTIYEAGSIFAVGTVFAVYRMQTGWQTATKGLETGLLQEGRDVIRRVTQRMRELVEMKADEAVAGDPVEQQMLEEATQAVNKTKAALEQLQQKA
ncbi:hypothetical protein LTR64_004540 [Lithohypha guttulata]|uniref:uncharacterized protein n=1 Tax=Lithohypha guttulata TaxID=1690604 RepID=UPI002DE122C2|nr:hypothetical protein LTR51_006162 [Lithohypha guttulata]